MTTHTKRILCDAGEAAYFGALVGLVVGLFFATAGCTGALAGGTFGQEHPLRYVRFTAPAPGTATLTPDHADPQDCTADDPARPLRFTCLFDARTDHATLRFVAPGYEPWASGELDVRATIDLPEDLVQLVPVLPLFVHAFAPERGPLHVCGRLFCDDAGAVWQWRGASLYRLFGRYLAGEPLDPVIHDLWRLGINVIRVWPEQDGGTNRTYDRPDFDRQLAWFIDALGEAGIRVELTAITEYRRALTEDRQTVQRVYAVAAGRWNVFVECVNEPWNGGAPNPLEVCGGIDRHGVLSAYGLDPYHSGGSCSYPGATCPHLDYVTTHLPRERSYFYRNPHDLVELRAVGVPVVDDEPLGAADYDKDGGGARSTDVRAFVSHVGICVLYGAGCTLHSQAGLEGRLPSDAEPITARIYDAVSQVWQLLPTTVAAGGYVRAPGGGSGGDFALTITRNDLADGRGYGSLLGDTQYVVLPQSRDFPLRAGFAAIPRGSWQTVEPLGDGESGIYRVTR